MKYKVLITDIAKEDIKEKKKYILRNFKYREYAEHFSRKIKKAVQELDTLPDGNGSPHPAGRHGLGEYYQTMDQQKTLNILRIEGPDS